MATMNTDFRLPAGMTMEQALQFMQMYGMQAPTSSEPKKYTVPVDPPKEFTGRTGDAE